MQLPVPLRIRHESATAVMTRYVHRMTGGGPPSHLMKIDPFA